MTIAQPKARRPLSGMTRICAAALAGLAGFLGYAQVMFGAVDPLISGISLLALALAGVVATGWRWAPLVGVVVFGLLAALAAMSAGEIAFLLSRPGDVEPFSLVVLALPLVAVGLTASIWATVQNARGGERRTPRGTGAALAALAGAVGAALLVATGASGTMGAGVCPETLAGLPAVTLADFEVGTIRVKAGETVALRLENADPVPHQFDVDELGVHAPMPGEKDSLALFKAPAPGRYLFYCDPHYDKETGDGMHGTLIVE